MAIAIECTCGKRFNVKDEWAGEQVECQVCQTLLLVPMREGGIPPVEIYEEPVQEEVVDTSESQKMCEYCAEAIPSSATFCPYCGETLNEKISQEQIIVLLKNETEKLDEYTSVQDNIEQDKKLAGSLLATKTIIIAIFTLIGIAMITGGALMHRNGVPLVVIGIIVSLIFGISWIVSFVNDLTSTISDNETALKAINGFLKGVKTNRIKKAYARLIPTARHTVSVTYPNVEKINISTDVTQITSPALLKKYWKGLINCTAACNRTSQFNSLKIVSGGQPGDKYAIAEMNMKITTYPSWLIILIFINLLIAVLVIIIVQKSETIKFRKLLIQSNGKWYMASGEFNGILDNLKSIKDLS